MVDRLGVNTLAEIEANLETGESVKDALGENAEVIRDILRDYYREQGEPMLRRMAVKRHWTDAEINERRQTRIDNSMDGVSIFTLEDIVHHAWDMYQDGARPRAKLTGWLPLTRCAAPWMTTPLRSGLPGSWTACWARRASTMARTPTPPPAISAASRSSTMPTPWRTSSRR